MPKLIENFSQAIGNFAVFIISGAASLLFLFIKMVFGMDKRVSLLEQQMRADAEKAKESRDEVKAALNRIQDTIEGKEAQR